MISAESWSYSARCATRCGLTQRWAVGRGVGGMLHHPLLPIDRRRPARRGRFVLPNVLLPIGGLSSAGDGPHSAAEKQKSNGPSLGQVHCSTLHSGGIFYGVSTAYCPAAKSSALIRLELSLKSKKSEISSQITQSSVLGGITTSPFDAHSHLLPILPPPGTKIVSWNPRQRRGRGSRRLACRDARGETSPSARRFSHWSSPACSASARP